MNGHNTTKSLKECRITETIGLKNAYKSGVKEKRRKKLKKKQIRKLSSRTSRNSRVSIRSSKASSRAIKTLMSRDQRTLVPNISCHSTSMAL